MAEAEANAGARTNSRRLTHAQAAVLKWLRAGQDVAAEVEAAREHLWEINFLLEQIDLLSPDRVAEAAKELRSTVEDRNALLRKAEPPSPAEWKALFEEY